MSTLRGQIGGDRLTTIQVIYHLPDYPSLLQEFLWQTYDRPPHYPRLARFLAHWQRSIHARLHSVRINAHAPLQPVDMRRVDHLLTLH